jgi:hypothetical protein
MSNGKLSIFSELWQFLRVRKKWWLAPILIVLVLFAFLLIFAQTSVLAPFIYTLI